MTVLTEAAHKRDVSVALVSKVVCAHPSVIACINQSGCDMLADSRLENLQSADTSLLKLSLRVSMTEQAEEVVRVSDVSLESEEQTILALQDAAEVVADFDGVVIASRIENRIRGLPCSRP